MKIKHLIKLGLILLVINTIFLNSIVVKAIDYQDIHYEKLKQSVLLMIGNSKAYIHGSETQIDPASSVTVPFIIEGRTLVPVRFISESFGTQVNWDDNKRTVKITKDGLTISLEVGKKIMQVNQNSIELDVPAQIFNGRVYLPLRKLVVDALGKDIFYGRKLIVISEKQNKLTVEGNDIDRFVSMFKNPPEGPYMVYYGSLTPDVIKIAKTYKIVIINPVLAEVSRTQVEEIQKGVDSIDSRDDVKVFGYISAGEDLRTTGLTPSEMKNDKRFVGDGTGPRIDPRGTFPNGNADLNGIDCLGNPSIGGSGFASYYLDDNNMDGLPDFNKAFNGAFVNAGDPEWFDVVNNMTLDGSDKVAGLKEILTKTYGRGLGCDGVFLDTIDTCAPNSYTDSSSFNQSEFEWTTPGLHSFIKNVRLNYPEKLIIQNRGLFFFNPNLAHYKYSTRPLVDYVMFESLRLNSSPVEEYNQEFFEDNCNNFAPKIACEANRPDGFRVLSLGYAEGPADKISKDTLIGKSNIGFDSLIKDIEVANQFGFIHYLTNSKITLANSFVRDHSPNEDTQAPNWLSTWNNDTKWPSQKPLPRVGIQEIEESKNSVTVRWDLALDENNVKYLLYYQTIPFDFSRDPLLKEATKKTLTPTIGKGYENGTGGKVFPYEAKIDELQSGIKYYFVIRAVDKSKNANQELNQKVLTATPQ